MVITDTPLLIILLFVAFSTMTIKAFISHNEKKGGWLIMTNIIYTLLNLLEQLTINMISTLLPLA